MNELASGDARPRRNGFALIIVLWSLGLLALIGSQITANARMQLRLAADVRARAIAEAAADGAINQAEFLLLQRAPIEGRDRRLQILMGEAVVTVVLEYETNKINPNTAPRDVLGRLLVEVGVNEPLAARLSGEIIDWRNRDAASVLGGQKIDQYSDRGLPYRSGDERFQSVDQVGLVPDMTPAILSLLRPWLSVYHRGGVTIEGTESPTSAAVRYNRNRRRQFGPSFVNRNVIDVTAIADVPGRARFVRRAVLQIRAEEDANTRASTDLIRVQDWE